MDASVAKLLSIHVPALHPPSATSLFLPTNVQIAALVGVGLLYQSTVNRYVIYLFILIARRMTELLLAEIGRKPNDSTSNFIVNRESYALAAGMALGT